jgi:hypothetical protein
MVEREEAGMTRRLGGAVLALVFSMLLVSCPDPVADVSQDGGDSSGGDDSGSGESGAVAVIADLSPGDLVITEVMQNPAAVIDSDGEWFEVYVAYSQEVDLNGLTISDVGSDSHTITSSLVVQPGSYVVFGRTGDLVSNGGVSVDYEYAGDMSLSNAADEIVLAAGATQIDAVAYDESAGWPDPLGASMQLDSGSRNSADNDTSSNWCTTAVATYGDGDKGTPGATNEDCGGI